MDDWEDWDSGNVRTESSPPLQNGKIFGSRGRGFAPATNSSKSGGWPPPKSDSRGRDGWSDNKENGGGDRRAKGKDDEWMGSRMNGRKPREGRNEESTQKPKPKSTYVPEEPTQDENEIFGNGISSGINFSKYDDIEVRVSGENPPRAINTFEEAGLRGLLIELIKKCSYQKPTPIQKYSIPIIMSGRDMMACAQTGSGKTAAFLIPIIQRLLELRSDCSIGICKPQAVIVSPTRELAIQIFNEARKFSHGSILRVAITYGGTALRNQRENIQKGCHILVATPGRLLDFLRRGCVSLEEIKFTVLDEADRMLDMGFLPDMETLLTHSSLLPGNDRQTLMFSATFPEEIQRLAGKFLNDYLFVAVGIVGGACSDVEQRFFCVSKFEKRNKLVELLSEMDKEKTLIFVEQKRTTDFIATFLCETNFPATSIHGDREQKEREEALKDFKRGHRHILVATSVAARGLDIKNVAHVINFDMPHSVDEYVHRIGRTGRVGNRGLATSFYDPVKDKPIASDLVKVLTQAGQKVPEFLRAESSGRSTYCGSSKFGGSDFRDQHDDFGQAREAVFEEEMW